MRWYTAWTSGQSIYNRVLTTFLLHLYQHFKTVWTILRVYIKWSVLLNNWFDRRRCPSVLTSTAESVVVLSIRTFDTKDTKILLYHTTSSPKRFHFCIQWPQNHVKSRSLKVWMLVYSLQQQPCYPLLRLWLPLTLTNRVCDWNSLGSSVSALVALGMLQTKPQESIPKSWKFMLKIGSLVATTWI